MSDLFGKAKEFVDTHEKQVDEALDRLGDKVDERTGGRFTEQIDKAVDVAQSRTGNDEQAS